MSSASSETPGAPEVTVSSLGRAAHSPEVVPASYPVSIWEGLAIAAGALFLSFAGFMGLVDKAVRNATNAERAEAIARSLMDYSLPGGSQGTFGINIGSVKMAVVTSRTSALPESPNHASLPTIELLIARTPLRQYKVDGEDAMPLVDNFNLVSIRGFSVAYNLVGNFQATSAQQESRLLCGNVTEVTIQQGTIIPDNPSVPAIPAVRYEAHTVVEDRQHQIILTGLGDNAAQGAEQVFNSLNCR